MTIPSAPSHSDQTRALWLSTLAFTLCFCSLDDLFHHRVQIKRDLGAHRDPIRPAGRYGPSSRVSLIRLILGIWADQYGGRIVYAATMLAASVATLLLTFAYDYPTFLLAALGVGIAGGSFAVGVTYVSKWYPKEKQGTALGIFGAGNVGAAVTKFAAPFIMLAYGWRMVAIVWAVALAVMTVVFWFGTKDDPDLARRRSLGLQPEPISALLEPLEERSGLALRPLLLLRLRRLRRARPLAAALPHRRLWPRHCDGRHGRRRLFGSRLDLPRLWRPPLRQVRARGPSCTGRSSSRSSAPSCCPTRRRNTWCAPPLAPSPSTWRSASSPSW